MGTDLQGGRVRLWVQPAGDTICCDSHQHCLRPAVACHSCPHNLCTCSRGGARLGTSSLLTEHLWLSLPILDGSGTLACQSHVQDVQSTVVVSHVSMAASPPLSKLCNDSKLRLTGQRLYQGDLLSAKGASHQQQWCTASPLWRGAGGSAPCH